MGREGQGQGWLETSEQEMSASFGNMEVTDVLLGSVSMVPWGEMAEKEFR